MAENVFSDLGRLIEQLGKDKGIDRAVVIEEASISTTTKEATADTGYRVIVKLSGYSATSRIFAPDVIVGSDGTSPTSTGSLNTALSPGSYTLGANQLLFSRVAGRTQVAPAARSCLPTPTLRSIHRYRKLV